MGFMSNLCFVSRVTVPAIASFYLLGRVWGVLCGLEIEDNKTAVDEDLEKNGNLIDEERSRNNNEKNMDK